MAASVFHDNFFAMGTRLEVVLWDVDEGFARGIYNDIHDRVKQLESDISHYDEKSPITAINKNAGVKPVPVSPRVLSLLQKCLRHSEKTGGLFDITAGSGGGVVQQSFDSSPATNSGIVTAGSDLLHLSSDEETAYLSRSDVTIDLGGVGKGMALGQVGTILDEYHVEHALVSFGESSILTRGRHPHGPHWKIGIRDMTDENTSRYGFKLNDHALSTSGNTPRNGGSVRHPRIGEAHIDYQTVSVLTSDPVEAEVLSTALLVADRSESRRLMRAYEPEEAVRIVYDANGQFRTLTEITQSYFS